MSPSQTENTEALELKTDAVPPGALARAVDDLPGAKKAAILCLSLGEVAATALFKHLDEDEVQILSKELALLPNVKSRISDSVIEEFHQLLTVRSYVSAGGVDYAKRLLNNSFSGERAKDLTDKVMHA